MGPPLHPDARVLVRLPSWLGDLVAAEPAVRALDEHLRARGGAARLSLAGPGHLFEVLEGRFPEARRISHTGRGGERARDWRGHDAALLLTGSFRSAWTAWRAGIGRRVGFARDGRAALLTDRLRPALERGGTPLGIGRRGRGRRVLPRPLGASCTELVGLLGIPVHDSRPRLVPTEVASEAARRRLATAGIAEGGGYVLANVGSRPGSAKGLPASSWGRALDELAARAPLPIALVCGPGEEVALQDVHAAARARTVPLASPSVGLGELLALCAGARLVLTADAGPRHVALATGAPLVCACGPTDPRHTADHLARQRVVRVDVPCGPCHRERCPLVGEERHACMLRIEPEELAAQALALLE